ncbi:mucin-13 [Chionomys nivalis]|uniref:mucin-13 n=1 Tax=Chionomys nivalis TaxID=269649 RepID=UPI0025937FB3|nr:mucin-13 [Chionomys nivalis]
MDRDLNGNTRLQQKQRDCSEKAGTSATETPTTPKPGTAATETPTTPKPGTAATETPTTPKPGTAATETPTTPKPGTASTETPTTTKPGTASTETPTTTKPGTASTETPTTTKPGTASTETPTTTKPGTASTETPTTTKPGTAATETPTTPKPGTASTETPTTPKPGTASTETPTTTKPGTASTETPTTTKPGTASTETPTTTKPGTASTETPTTTKPGTASTQTPTTTKPGTASTQTPTTTQSPGVSSQTTSPGPQDHCKPNPCGGSASCVNLNTEWFCVCPEGYYYQNASPSCEKGKTFPGEIGVTMTETTDLDNKTSPAYQALYSKVVKFFQKAFNETEARSDYGQTIIIKVSASPSLSTRSAMRAADETIVNVSVVNMFHENTNQNESTISAIIKKAVTNDTDMRNYTEEDLCDYYGCNNNEDGCQNPLQCTCKPGFTRSSPQNPFCLPLECSRSCSAEEKKQCLKNGDGPLACLCMPGYQKSTGDKCEACPFGYSGQNCKDAFQLILTIVGTVAGALILILLIAFIVSVSSKNKKKNVEEQKLIDEDFQNVRMQQTGFSNSGFSNSGFSNNSDFSNFGAGNSIFPKVRTQNPYANQRSMPRPDY